MYDLLAFSVEIALTLACTLIGQFLNSWRVTSRKHLTWSIQHTARFILFPPLVIPDDM